MGADSLNRVVRHLRGGGPSSGDGLTDGELLDRYRARRDEAAFEALLRRHGPMVLGVCRRVLGNEADAEDAFQATFLVLVRKAASIRQQGMVSNWLYGVAHHTALKAKAMHCKRRAKEKEAGELPRTSAAEEVWRQAQTLVDDALSRLAEKYRVPIVLCDLEGKTIKEAARQLGWPQGTVATRLTRGRVQLARRLARSGLNLSAGAVTALLAQAALSAQVPGALVTTTLKAAALFAAGNMLAGNVASATALALTQGVLNAMYLSKLKIVGGTLALAIVLGLGVGASIMAGGGAPTAAAAQALHSAPDDESADSESNGAQQEPRDPLRQKPRPKSTTAVPEAQLDDNKPAPLPARIDALEQQIKALTTELSVLRKGPRGPFTPLTPTPPVRTDVKIFNLRNAEAGEVAATLKQLLAPDDRAGGFGGSRDGAQPRWPRIATHQSTNSVLVQGTPEELETVAAIIIQLDEREQSPKKPPVNKGTR